MILFIKLGIVFGLIALNGYFVAAEFTLVAIKKIRIESLAKKGDRLAALILVNLTQLDTLISSTQLGITIASLALGWLGESAMADFFIYFLNFLPQTIARITAHSFAVVLAFLSITFLHIVFGETVPKYIALRRSERVAYLVIVPLVAFTNLFKPLIWAINATSNQILRFFGINPPLKNEATLTVDEIKMILEQSGQTGLIPKSQVVMIENVLRLRQMPITQIMVPRTAVIAFSINLPLRKIARAIEKYSTYSRFPVYRDHIDDIVGFIHMKDIYRAIVNNQENKKLKETNLIRDTLNIPISKKVEAVLHDMRQKRIHIAIIKDEYGGTVGTVTLEDIVESLVGAIEDEFDRPLRDIRRLPDKSFVINAHVNADKIIGQFNLPAHSERNNTVGGLVFSLLGEEPKLGDTVRLGDYYLQVLEMGKTSIKTIRIKKKEK